MEEVVVLIGIDASRLLTGQRTGTETYTYQILRHIAALYATGEAGSSAKADIVRLYFNQRRGRAVDDALSALDPTHTAPLEARPIPLPRLWTHFRLSLELSEHQPDRLFVPAHVVPALHPASVVTLHDVAYRYYPDTYTPAQRRYLDLSTRWSLFEGWRVIVPSDATKQDLIKFYAAPPGKIRVVPHGYDRDIFQPVTDPALIAAAMHTYGIGGRYLLFVGTIQPRKNLIRLFDAFDSLRADPAFADVRLVVAGKPGWLSAPIIARANALGDRIVLLGYVAQTDLAALISGALAFVYPSLYEGFGLPVLEAMACGAVVVASDTPALAEVAGDAALLPDPNDTAAIAAALRAAVIDERQRATLRARALARAATYSWQTAASTTLGIIRNG